MPGPNRSGLPKSHPDYWKNLHYLTRYGVNMQHVQTLLAAQGGKCAICGTTEHGGKNWHLDHDHTTGVTRGALCKACNMALGFFKDSSTLLEAAAAYLKSYKGALPCPTTRTPLSQTPTPT